MALTKSTQDKVLGGVIGGLAREWDIDPTLLRVLYVVLTLITGILLGIVVYLVLYLVMD